MIPNPALITFIQRQESSRSYDSCIRQAEQVGHNAKDIDLEKVRAELANEFDVEGEIPDWLAMWFASEIIEHIEREAEDFIADMFDTYLPRQIKIDISRVEENAAEAVAAYMERMRPVELVQGAER